MKHRLIALGLMTLFISSITVSAQTSSVEKTPESQDRAKKSQTMPTTKALPDSADLSISEPLYKPFIERYILDEIKSVRQDQLVLRADVEEKVAKAKLESSDRALRYTADTTNNIFYIITTAASVLVLLGWRSLKDIRENIEAITENKLAELTLTYESRLNEIERKMKVRSEQIMAAQEEISLTNQVHSLWMRAGLEKNEQDRIKIYDHILEISPDDIEALTYKADALLEMGEKKWALSLSNQAIEKDDEYSFAYWQRACANAELGHEEEAMDDIEVAIKLSTTFKDELLSERSFKSLQTNERFCKIAEGHGVSLG